MVQGNFTGAFQGEYRGVFRELNVAKSGIPSVGPIMRESDSVREFRIFCIN